MDQLAYDLTFLILNYFFFYLFCSPNLTWRDVQYIVVYSSNPNVPSDSKWMRNGVGLKYSHKFGFGLMDASALVNRARYWTNVPERQNCSVNITTNNQ